MKHISYNYTTCVVEYPRRYDDQSYTLMENQTDEIFEITDDQYLAILFVLSTRTYNPRAGGDFTVPDYFNAQTFCKNNLEFMAEFLHDVDNPQIEIKEAITNLSRSSNLTLLIESISHLIPESFYDYELASNSNPDGPTNGGGVNHLVVYNKATYDSNLHKAKKSKHKKMNKKGNNKKLIKQITKSIIDQLDNL